MINAENRPLVAFGDIGFKQRGHIYFKRFTYIQPKETPEIISTRKLVIVGVACRGLRTTIVIERSQWYGVVITGRPTQDYFDIDSG